MADYSSGPEDTFRFQDDSPPPAREGTRKPKRPRPPEEAPRPRPKRKDRDTSKWDDSSGGGGSSWFQPKPMTWKQGVILAAIVVPLIGFAAGMAIWQNQHRSWAEKAFGAAMNDYLAPTVPAAAGAPRPAFGKAVMVDATKRKLDYLHWSLPGDMAAGAPEEVTTVVQLHYTEQVVGEYTGGGRALKVTCNVVVVDKASRVVLGSQTFVGADPPQFTKTSAGEDDRGELPTADIMNFLKQLRKG